jgi:hypothetical protein
MPVEKKKHVLTEMDEQKQALVERFAYEELQEEEEESIVSQMQQVERIVVVRSKEDNDHQTRRASCDQTTKATQDEGEGRTKETCDKVRAKAMILLEIRAASCALCCAVLCCASCHYDKDGRLDRCVSPASCISLPDGTT